MSGRLQALPKDLNIDRAHEAHTRILPYVRRTPVLPASVAAEGGDSREVFIKAELFQPGGSFKLRGALNTSLQLSPEESRNGVVSMSAGNHAIAVAFAARVLGIPATIVMPAGASQSKVTATRELGAEVVLTDAPLEETMHEIRESRGLCLVHPFDDSAVVLGAATAGIELIEDAPALDAVFVPVGGGGLISGIALAVKSLSPSTRVIGVEPEGATAMQTALASADGSARPASQQSVADGLKAPYAGAINLLVVRELVDDMITVTEEQIAWAFSQMYRGAKLAVEPAAAVGLAGILTTSQQGSAVATIASGGNVDVAVVKQLLG